jgi:hypothetical protein
MKSKNAKKYGLLNKPKKSTGKKPTGKKPTGKKPTGKKPTGKKPMGKKPMGKKPTGKKHTGKKPTGKKPMGKKPMGKKHTGKKKYMHLMDYIVNQPKKHRYSIHSPSQLLNYRGKKCKSHNLKNRGRNAQCICNQGVCSCKPLYNMNVPDMKHHVHGINVVDSSSYSNLMGHKDFKRKSIINENNNGIQRALMMVQDNDNISYQRLM